MSLRHRLRTLLVCVVLEWSALIGMPMRPEEIVDLMQTMNTPKVVHTIPDEDETGDFKPDTPEARGNRTLARRIVAAPAGLRAERTSRLPTKRPSKPHKTKDLGSLAVSDILRMQEARIDQRIAGGVPKAACSKHYHREGSTAIASAISLRGPDRAIVFFLD